MTLHFLLTLFNEATIGKQAFAFQAFADVSRSSVYTDKTH